MHTAGRARQQQGAKPLLQRRGQRARVARSRKAELDPDLDAVRARPDGLHSFGVLQGHPEVRFDIIPDHKAGFADAIV